MIRIFVLLLACMGAVLSGGAEAATISRETSPGGLSYMRIFIPDADKIAIRIAWPSDWAWRRNVNQAVPHVGAELILLSGAKGFPAGKAVEQFADMKGVAIDAIMNGLPEGKRRARPATRTDFSPRRILLHIPEAKAATLVFAGPLPSISKGGEIEDVLLASLLGGGPGSVLFDAVRTKLRAAYAFGTRLEAYTREIRLLVMAGQVKPARLADVEQAVRRAYADFRKNGTLQGFEHRKSRLAATIAKNMKDPLHISLSALLGWLAGQRPEMVVKLASEIRAVPPADLRRRLATAFPPSRRLIVLAVSPKANALPGACVITRPKEADRCK